jgi:rhodanese-related sulfurtransferase
LSDFLISIDELKSRLGTPAAPRLVDVRRRTAYDEDTATLAAARWRDHTQVDAWATALPAGAPVVVACAHGAGISQLAAAVLRRRGIDARALASGVEGWRKAGGAMMLKAPLASRGEGHPSRWVTRVRPKIDRIACPWLISRFVDPEAEFYFVEPSVVVSVAKDLGGIPYDIDGVEMSHDGELCTFDTLIRKFGLSDPALADLACIVRGADTARLDLAPEAAGLLAVSLGISALAGGDDHEALRRGFPVYDALYAWRRHAASETHNWPSRSA